MKSKLASLLCCLIVLINLSGCTKVTQLVKDSQPTKAELLDEINTEHQRWEAAPAADPTPYLRHYDDPADAQKDTDYFTDTYSEYDAEKELTVDEAKADVTSSTRSTMIMLSTIILADTLYSIRQRLILCRKSKAGTA